MNDDATYMAQALALARQQHGRTASNPSVGCVIIGQNGKIIAQAATGDGGRPHAEQLALGQIDAKLSTGATAYVTLEPCGTRSTGEPSCSDRLIEARVARVCYATDDLHPLGHGGADKLRLAGIEVHKGVLQADADVFYQDFFARLDKN
ncbi:MAG: bifunctional diaminohydroxyphosphoribosylaminopyrimidine deaminase/5-amino-6-(5-phosphoribosylamino)uracil reductase RibD [Henriciella sp.]